MQKSQHLFNAQGMSIEQEKNSCKLELAWAQIKQQQTWTQVLLTHLLRFVQHTIVYAVHVRFRGIQPHDKKGEK